MNFRGNREENPDKKLYRSQSQAGGAVLVTVEGPYPKRWEGKKKWYLSSSTEICKKGTRPETTLRFADLARQMASSIKSFRAPEISRALISTKIEPKSDCPRCGAPQGIFISLRVDCFLNSITQMMTSRSIHFMQDHNEQDETLQKRFSAL